MFSTTQQPAMHIGLPDICNVPTPAGTIPTMFVDLGTSSTAIPNILNIFLRCMPAHNILTEQPMSNGNELGVGGGLISGENIASVMHVLGCLKYFKSCAPNARMLGITIQNSINAPGSTLVPSQTLELTGS